MYADWPLLSLVIWTPIFGAILVLFAGDKEPSGARKIALVVSVITDAQEDIDYVRALSLKNGEEKKLAVEGHTVHYDGYNDQARDKAATKVLKTPEMKMSKVINNIDREEGYGYQIKTLSDGTGVMKIMKEDPPDMLILDVMMPKKNGLEVLQEVRREHRLPDS